VKLCYINRSGPVFFETHCISYITNTHTVTLLWNTNTLWYVHL